MFFYFILFLNFTILYWFFQISKWICHRYTCVTHPEPSSLPIASLWVVLVHQPQASSIVHRTWTGDLFHIWCYTCFNAILPNHSPSPSPTESKGLFYTSVSLLLSCIQGLCRIFMLSLEMEIWLEEEGGILSWELCLHGKAHYFYLEHIYSSL